MTLIFYAEKTSPRLEYVLSVFLGQLLELDYQLITDREVFEKSNLPKINYTQKRISKEELFLQPHSILFEKSIKFQSIKPHPHQNLPAFFYTSAEKTDLPFDIFALTFYLLSRYEEYLSFNEDAHGRFTASESLAFQCNFLQRPLINLWSLQFSKILTKKYPQLRFSTPQYRFQPTYDIDFAWSYKNKGFIRTAGGYFRAISKMDFKTLKERFLVQISQQADPFYTFNYLEDLHQKYELLPIWFFLLGDYGEFDKNVSIKNEDFQKLIQSIDAQYPTGIHPSYQSNSAIGILKNEKKRLEEITQKDVTKSRQHFLKLSLPKTYQNLLKTGITDDYTMGYATEIGFRASIAQPFLWYDLKSEKTTNLRIHPFQIMDVTLQQYLKLSPNEAIDRAIKIIESTKAIGGTFVSLWHNSSFSNEKKWRGWKRVYERILEAAV
ncbi:MAG: hypothetical protein ACI9XO_000279 [Paraglaciecola sp.]|jgi:hypothetical protein